MGFRPRWKNWRRSELSCYRICGRAIDAAQQEVLARFCGELGGGVLLLGGAATFDGSWQNSRLEQLLR